jgi:hypothetical protein
MPRGEIFAGRFGMRLPHNISSEKMKRTPATTLIHLSTGIGRKFLCIVTSSAESDQLHIIRPSGL